ncbi:transposase [Allorhodopirellula solitaria]|uniref:Transposase IS200 like protein n=1 Tax=Allorhodopirellula solitaria TaxID=2527987 RepID=A0A5C5XTK7_9BACT|nr:transposase [Allorhodopirellula solitaria]TWT66606.1 Transposase IS200 like protein [Allorhodopirellula solitaria]
MPRTKRADEAGRIYHALNRGNDRREIFHKPEDYLAFQRTLQQGLEKYPVDLLAYCLMPNHWHLVVRPRQDGRMGKLLGWVSATHTSRYNAHNQRVGMGHLYQGPFKSFPCQADEHFLTVCRYVERNALSSKLVSNAEDWQFGSLHRWHSGNNRDSPWLTPWPMRRPPHWLRRVNASLSKKELDAIENAIKRGCPYGSKDWMERTCERTGIWSTMRPRGRPRSKAQVEAVQKAPK